MTWRMAKSLDVLLAQVNALSPNRDKSSDGGIGNAEHASRSSDHNPWVMDGSIGVVTARDFTNDPAHGIVSEQLAEALRASRDRRIKYIISNRKIAASYAIGNRDAWEWRPYTGANPHDHHCHISVSSDKEFFDSTEPWNISLKPAAEAVAAPAVPATPILRKGASGPNVIRLQELLNESGAVLKADGNFGPVTELAVRKFQGSHHLVADGKCGPYTWRALES